MDACGIAPSLKRNASETWRRDRKTHIESTVSRESVPRIRPRLELRRNQTPT